MSEQTKSFFQFLHQGMSYVMVIMLSALAWVGKNAYDEYRTDMRELKSITADTKTKDALQDQSIATLQTSIVEIKQNIK